MARFSRLNRPDLPAIVAQSKSCTEVMQAVGLKPTGGNFHTLQTYIKKLGLSTDNFAPNYDKIRQARFRGRPVATPIELMFRKDSSHSRGAIRKRILRDNLLPYLCGLCDNPGEWRGAPLPLDLDHINGDPLDHRLENLRWLCPNCHGQTPTHCRKKNHARA